MVWCDELNGGWKNPEENLGQESCSCLLCDSPLNLNIAIKFTLYEQSPEVTSGGEACWSQLSVGNATVSLPSQGLSRKKSTKNAALSGSEIRLSA